MQQFFKKEAAQLRANHSVQSILWILFGMLAWLFVWFVPWYPWLGTSLWLKVGIALAIFITPGGFLYLLVSRGAIVKSRFLTSGFVLSHLMIAFLGISGRIFQFPFTYVKNTFMASGLVFIAILFLTNSQREKNAPSPRSWMARYASYWPLGILTALTMLMTIQRIVTSDDLAYLAHLTNWQNMPQLDFSDVYFGSNQIESARFWIVSTPFSQAFLAELANIPGLVLLSGYYEPFLVLISILCFYDLARTFGLSHYAAMASVVLQVTFMALLSDYLHPGAPFFHQLSTDKATAAFILTPVFISNAIQLLEGSKKGLVINFFLSGLSLSFMHPILSAFAVFIVGTISFFGIKRDNFKKHSIVILLTVLTLLPQIGVRLIDHEAQPNIPNDINSIEGSRGIEGLITRVGTTQFYGFNPAILEMRIPYQERMPFPGKLVSWVWIVIPILTALVALKGVNNHYLKQYILAATLLVALAGIPYTGWILGYFVSAWMLERTTWLYPFGISAIFLMLTLGQGTNFGKSLTGWKIGIRNKLQIDFATLGRASFWAGSILLILLVMREQGLPNIERLQSSTRRYQELALIGKHIDENAPGPVRMVGSDELNDFIPALSWKAKTISYRPEDTAYPYFYTEEEKMKRWSDRQAILSKEVAPDERMKMIQKYDILYVLIESYRLGWLKELISTYPMNFKTFSFGRYMLIEIIGS